MGLKKKEEIRPLKSGPILRVIQKGSAIFRTVTEAERKTLLSRTCTVVGVGLDQVFIGYAFIPTEYEAPQWKKFATSLKGIAKECDIEVTHLPNEQVMICSYVSSNDWTVAMNGSMATVKVYGENFTFTQEVSIGKPIKPVILEGQKKVQRAETDSGSLEEEWSRAGLERNYEDYY